MITLVTSVFPRTELRLANSISMFRDSDIDAKMRSSKRPEPPLADPVGSETHTIPAFSQFRDANRHRARWKML